MRRRPPQPDPCARATLVDAPRWRDDDAYGHLNNATYYELFDTAVNAHLYRGDRAERPALPQIGVVAETSCRYFRELGFPEPIETGLVVDKVGTSSVVYRIGLFQGDSARGGGRGPLRPRVRRQHRPGPPRRADARRDPRGASSRCCAADPPVRPQHRPGNPFRQEQPLLVLTLIMARHPWRSPRSS